MDYFKIDEEYVSGLLSRIPKVKATQDWALQTNLFNGKDSNSLQEASEEKWKKYFDKERKITTA